MPDVLLGLLLLGVLLLAGIDAVTSWLLARRRNFAVLDRYAAATAVAAAFFIGYWITTGGAHWTPTRHWHWLPYLGLVAMLLGPLANARGVRAIERWALMAVLAWLTAWFLVPEWETLDPPRSTYLPIVTAYVAMLAIASGPLAARLPAARLGCMMALSAGAVGLMILFAASQTSGRLGLLVAAAVGGVAVAAAWVRPQPSALRGLAGVYAVLAGGTAFVGTIEPIVPMYEFMLAAAAPLALWFGQLGPARRLTGIKSLALDGALVMVPIVAAAGWLGIRLVTG